MKIIINAVSAKIGGGISYLVNMLELLPEMFHQASFLVFISDITLPKSVYSNANIQIEKVAEISRNVLWRYAWENTTLIARCKAWNADLLFCVANIIPLRSPQIPVIVMIQNVAPLTPRYFSMMKKFASTSSFLKMFLLKILTLYAIRNSSRSISLSRATKKLLQRYSPGCKTDVLYHGVGSMFSQNFARPAQAGSDPYFIYVSNIYVYKGLEYIVRALAIDPGLPKVFVAGAVVDKAYYQYILKLAKEYQVSKRIIFLQSVDYDQLAGWYANAVAMVYASWCENCPNILLEAMACGCPVVAMNIGPMPEICADAGIMVKPFSSEEMAKGMRVIVTGDQQKKKKAALKRAALFTWEKAIQDHINIFKSCI